MAEEAKVVQFTLDREKLKAALKTVHEVATGIAAITTTKVDDQVVEMLGKVISEDWFVDLVLLVADLFDRDTPRAEVEQKVKEILVTHE